MTNTPNLGLPYLDAAQSQKHVTHNEAIRALDALVQLAVIDQHLAAPPASPGNGDRYIVAAGGTGAWTGFDLQVAAFQDGAWAFHPPQKGWLAWVTIDGGLFGWNGAAWSLVGGVPSVNPVALVGINATADLTNRLAVKSPAILFDNTGSGVQAKINKAHPGDTASLLFQDGYSGRAEFGLTGDDNLHIKVSADGAVWNEAIIVNAASGAVSLPHTPPLQVNADWNAGSGLAQVLNKPVLATVATTGTYADLSGKPTIPTSPVNADWNAGSGLAQVLNKPTIPATYTLPAATPAALGGIKSGSGLAIAADGTLATPVHDAQARHFLRRWMGKTALLQQSVTTTRAVLAQIGDSWTFLDDITGPVRRGAQTRLGSAGIGYCSFTSIGGQPPRAVLASAGTWAESGGSPLAVGVDLFAPWSTDIATPARKTLTTVGTDFVLHYYQVPGGGSFTYAVDGGAATTVNTAAGAVTLATLSIPGLALGSHSIVFTVTVAGTAGVTLCGVDIQINQPGVRLHKIGSTGAQASSYLTQVGQANWQAALAALNPDTVIISFGTNDMNVNVPPATYAANLTTLVASVRTALPLADVVLLTPCDNGITGTTYTMAQYADAMAGVAAASNTGFINAFLDMGPYANANAMGLYADLGHLNASGGRMVANLVTNYLYNGVYSNPFAATGARNLFIDRLSGDPTFSGDGAQRPGVTNTTGTDNLGFGNTTFGANTTGSFAVAVGSQALLVNTTGNHNVALGYNTLVANTTAGNNVAIGSFASQASNAGSNVAIGYSSLGVNTAGGLNVAVGVLALQSVTTGDLNSAFGTRAGTGLTTGRANTVIGAAQGLAAALSNNIILADGDGNIGLQVDNARVARTNAATFILGSKVTITGGGTTLAPTLTTGPKAGNPTKWLPYDDNGVTRYIPAW